MTDLIIHSINQDFGYTKNAELSLLSKRIVFCCCFWCSTKRFIYRSYTVAVLCCWLFFGFFFKLYPAVYFFDYTVSSFFYLLCLFVCLFVLSLFVIAEKMLARLFKLKGDTLLHDSTSLYVT